ncbi:uncharacterized protein LOC112457718 isoform X1 [Temnothorax curvispinosus]|uniref:Uncharacterized protein LOC112457718 isoform X1 n=1 Tax=Temnothorax curvispinosus TaxID=300111 RepID=A0A6J1Q3E1_9HYME|nr:uncharacterized protein LOC112457718 isoform X1 [Temnothorax curvispinosus]
MRGRRMTVEDEAREEECARGRGTVTLWSARKFYTAKKKLQYTSRLRKYKWQTISQGGSLLRTRKRVLSDPLKLQKCEREVVSRLLLENFVFVDYSRFYLLNLSLLK